MDNIFEYSIIKTCGRDETPDYSEDIMHKTIEAKDISCLIRKLVKSIGCKDSRINNTSDDAQVDCPDVNKRIFISRIEHK